MIKLMRKKRIRRCAILILCAMLVSPFSAGISAANIGEGQAEETSGIYESLRSAGAPRIYINGQEYLGKAFLKDSTTYVGIREYAMFMGASSVDWSSAEKTAVITADNLTIRAKYLDTYITANGRYLWIKDGIQIIDGTMYVPIRTIAKAFNSTVEWNGTEFSVYVNGDGAISPAESYYDADCVLWLARIINAEACGEPLLGKIAVGNVVLNRTQSSLFPSTIYGVIFDKNCGIQFTPAANGTVYNTPNEESIIAAKLCLDGASVSDSVLFFVNQEIATNTWVAENRPYAMTIGNHTFFS